jgi:hypothetical protein
MNENAVVIVKQSDTKEKLKTEFQVIEKSFNIECNVTYIKYTLVGIGHISIPSTLELQAGDYKNQAESFQKAVGNEISGDRVVFQLKGRNDGKYPNTPSYEKIIFTTVRGLYYADYKKILTSKDATVRQKLLKELGDAAYQESINSPVPPKMISYDGASMVVVNGQSAIKISYLRQLLDNEPCYTEIYTFYNNDIGHLSLKNKYSDVY